MPEITPPAQVTLDDLTLTGHTKTVTMDYADLLTLYNAGAASPEPRVQEAAARLVALLDDYRAPSAEEPGPTLADVFIAQAEAEPTPPAEDTSQAHEFQQLPDVSVRVCYCGKWPDHDIHARAEDTTEPHQVPFLKLVVALGVGSKLTHEAAQALVAHIDALRQRAEGAEAERDRLAAQVARATTYTLSVLPETNINAPAFQLTVDYRGRDRWAVFHHSSCLGTDGDWDYEPRPSARDEEWIATHRFDLDTALRLAEEALPTLTVSGMPAADVLARCAALDTQEEADHG